ncbi:MAG: nuclear transport factor 2 family protein [Opitutus sp.]
MKTVCRLLAFCVLSLVSVISIRAADSTKPAASSDVIAAATAADVERMAAMIAADPVRLGAIFADDLRYAHSSGKVDHKASLIQSLVSHQTVYENFDVKERTVTVVANGAVMMAGRTIATTNNAGQKQLIDLNYLSVWREENGKWRFVAWQSCRNPAPIPPAATAPAKQ